MTEHEIRLRAGWTWRPAEPPGQAERRLELPGELPDGGPGGLVLERRFRVPPIDPRREAVALRLGAVPGLRAIELDGVAPPEVGPGPGEYAVGARPGARCRLTLRVGPDAIGRGSPWGMVALVIRPAGAALAGS